MNNTLYIFTDASTSPQAGIGIGAFVSLNLQQINEYAECSADILVAKIANIIVYKKYQSSQSTWVEIKTIIHALESIEKNQPVEIYTDCQSFCDLINKRKEKLEKNHFKNCAGKVLGNADLYKELFSLIEKIQIKVYKIKGHAPSAKRVTVQERIFSILDKLTRKKLRSFNKE